MSGEDAGARFGAGRYEIVRPLDRGGMGEVLLARQVNLDRLVVIKRALSPRSGRGGQAVLDEAHAAARLHHPNLVTVLDVGEDAGEPFVAMEYVDGQDLRTVLDRAAGGLPVDVALVIGIDLLRGLAYAHAVRDGDRVGLIHRDVKPRNAMVTRAGVTKLIDFGISRWLGASDAPDASSVSGTRGYMAPEQQGGGRVDGRADQFAVAVTLRELLTGVPPAGSDRTGAPEAATAAPPPIDLPPGLVAILARGCAAAPDDRYPDCSAMAAALEDHAIAAGLHLSPTAVAQWLAAHEAPAAPVASPDQATGATRAVGRGRAPAPSPRPARTDRAGRRRRWGWLALAAAAIVTASAVTAIALRSPPPAAAPLAIRVRAEAGARADDAWLALAAEHVVARALRDAPDRRYWVVAGDDAPAGAARPEVVSVRAERSPVGVHLRATVGGRLVGEVARSSLYASGDALAAMIAPAIGQGHAAAGPDPREAAEMRRIGARSFAIFTRYRTVLDAYTRTVVADNDGITAELEAVIAQDPTWAHPYVVLARARGIRTEAALAVLARAREAVDPARDPSGAALLDALARIATGDPNAAAGLAARARAGAGDDDLLVGLTEQAALVIGARYDEALAVSRHLHEVFPDLQFGSDVVMLLRRAGLLDDAGRLVAAWAAAWPDSAQATIELLAGAVAAGDHAAVAGAVDRLELLVGDAPGQQLVICDGLIAAGKLTEAHAVAERMLLGAEFARVSGRYRLGVLAVLEGRFAAAAEALAVAAEGFGHYGTESALTQDLELLRGIDPLAGRAGDEAAHVAELERAFAALDEPEVAVVYRYRGATLRGQCPDPEALLAAVPVGPRRNTARRQIVRAGAIARCAPCADAVATGLASDEASPASLLELGRCAEATGELDLARQVLERATHFTVGVFSNQASAYHAILAHYYLARVRAALGDRAGARAAYDAVLAAWGNADRPVPEVAAARRERAALGDGP